MSILGGITCGIIVAGLAWAGTFLAMIWKNGGLE